MQTACFVVSPVASPALQYFFTLSHKQQDFRGGGWGEIFVHKVCVLIFPTNFVRNVSHSKNRTKYDQKCILILVRYSCQIVIEVLISRYILEKYSNIKVNFKKFFFWEPSRSAGRAENVTKLEAAFPNSANVHKN
jgi:hypothetical protein